MKRACSALVSLIHALAIALVACATHAVAAVTFIGEGSIPGDARDRSGLAGVLEDGTPHDRAGGFGSALAWTGRGNLYIAAPDRGPADGATSYIDRIHTLRIDVVRRGPDAYDVRPAVVGTRLLRTEDGRFFTGSSAAFDATGSTNSLRLDPEGLRVSRCGTTAFVSDEYGPYLYEFDLATGRRVRSLALPNKFLVDAPSAVPAEEIARNLSGRQPNRGMEGLAISPDGRTLYGIMQSALIQDASVGGDLKRTSVNVRIAAVNVDTGETREFVYRMDSPRHGVNEIVAVNAHELLVLERDSSAGTDARFKKIFRIDLGAASNIRNVRQLPAEGPLPAGIDAVAKSSFIDLLDPAFGLAGPAFPEKLEGLTFGPDLPDGRHLLIVASDNDFIATEPSRLLAFAIDAGDLEYEPQRFVACARPHKRSARRAR